MVSPYTTLLLVLALCSAIMGDGGWWIPFVGAVLVEVGMSVIRGMAASGQ